MNKPMWQRALEDPEGTPLYGDHGNMYSDLMEPPEPPGLFKRIAKWIKDLWYTGDPHIQH